MTTDDIVISSTNFNVDKNGNMSCSNANVSGTITSNNATITGGSIKLIDNSGGSNSSLQIKNSSENQESYYSSGELTMYGEDGSVFLDTGVLTGDPWLYLQNNNNNLSTAVGASSILTPKVRIANEGYAMYGKNYGNDHIYRCNWTGSRLEFWVDATMVGTVSDKRLKSEIKDIDEDFIKAIKEIEMKQFKIDNRNGLISFGIIAQDLMEIFKKYNKNPFDYEIVQETKYKDNDDTIYYVINYEQFLVLKTKAQDLEIQELQAKDKEKDNLIQDLLKRVEKLEKGEK